MIQYGKQYLKFFGDQYPWIEQDIPRTTQSLSDEHIIENSHWDVGMSYDRVILNVDPNKRLCNQFNHVSCTCMRDFSLE